ncbi:MAG TPA: gamma-glutamylcyclotransferase family protein [Mucilaginibacter sp.]|nr:gamma-glutamylcyclotransferase family protein [Mucilaginibacter sp.]
MNDKLFVYGTLLDRSNKYGVYLKDNSTYYANGKVQGRLYDIGEYPGAVLTSGEGEYVYGTILKLKDPEETLIVLDEYEGFGEDLLQPNEFIRVLTRVETAAGFVDCWIYVYNLPIEGLPRIDSGKYPRYSI